MKQIEQYPLSSKDAERVARWFGESVPILDIPNRTLCAGAYLEILAEANTPYQLYIEKFSPVRDARSIMAMVGGWELVAEDADGEVRVLTWREFKDAVSAYMHDPTPLMPACYRPHKDDRWAGDNGYNQIEIDERIYSWRRSAHGAVFVHTSGALYVTTADLMPRGDLYLPLGVTGYPLWRIWEGIYGTAQKAYPPGEHWTVPGFDPDDPATITDYRVRLLKALED